MRTEFVQNIQKVGVLAVRGGRERRVGYTQRWWKCMKSHAGQALLSKAEVAVPYGVPKGQEIKRAKLIVESQ